MLVFYSKARIMTKMKIHKQEDKGMEQDSITNKLKNKENKDFKQLSYPQTSLQKCTVMLQDRKNLVWPITCNRTSERSLSWKRECFES